MNPSLCLNASRRKAVDDLAQVTPDKFQKRHIVIPNQDHQEQIISSPMYVLIFLVCLMKYLVTYFQKFITCNGQSPVVHHVL